MPSRGKWRYPATPAHNHCDVVFPDRQSPYFFPVQYLISADPYNDVYRKFREITQHGIFSFSLPCGNTRNGGDNEYQSSSLSGADVKSRPLRFARTPVVITDHRVVADITVYWQATLENKLRGKR